MTWLNGRFWSDHFKRVFKRQILVFSTAIEMRLLPTFDYIEAEAEGVALAEWENQSFDPDHNDESSMVNQAEYAGVRHAMEMESMRQTLLNLSVAGLYHFFEQQIRMFYGRQILKKNTETIPKVKVIKERLAELGLKLYDLPSWRKVDELRHVANAIKHAEGSSAIELRTLRPELFSPPALRADANTDTSLPSHIYMPLAGEDIFLSKEELKEYTSVLVAFWDEFAQAIEEF